MENFKYSLSKKGKHKCPECGRKSYVLYINNYTGEPLHPTVGICDKEKCKHHYPPRKFFADNKIPFDKSVVNKYNHDNRPTTPQYPTFYSDMETVKKSLSHYNENRFILWLTKIAGHKAAMDAAVKYYIGTSNGKWTGATTFWQVDSSGIVGSGRIMLYNPETGRRIKTTSGGALITWVHKLLYPSKEFTIPKFLFGAHLLVDKSKTVCLVESEKSATLASIYLPDFIWVACGGRTYLTMDRCNSLKGRNVILYPDVNLPSKANNKTSFDEWSDTAKELSKICKVTISDLLERGATNEERENGFDLADYLIHFPLADFTKQQSTKPEPEPDTPTNKPETTETPEPTAPQQPDKPVTASPPLNYPRGNTPCYVDGNGRLYIVTKKQSYAIYKSVDHLMSPLELPTVAPVHAVDVSGMNKIFIKYY